MDCISNKKMENDVLTSNEFIFLEEALHNKGWRLVKNEPTHIIYIKNGNETEYFEINVDLIYKKIFVSFPLKNSTYQYKTSFNTCYNAKKYIEDKMDEL